jgi:hypothetical protein
MSRHPTLTFTILPQLNHEFEYKIDGWNLFEAIEIKDISGLIAL